MLLRAMKFLVETEEQNADFLILSRKTPIGRTNTTGFIKSVVISKQCLPIRRTERQAFRFYQKLPGNSMYNNLKNEENHFAENFIDRVQGDVLFCTRLIIQVTLKECQIAFGELSSHGVIA